LGLDNIGPFDRSAQLPTGGYLDQADGTAWMALFCQNMLEIVEELAVHRGSNNRMFGGNSNWRGPVWMPLNTMIIRAHLQYYTYCGKTFVIEFPTGSGRKMNLYQIAEEIAHRLASIFLRDDHGRRPVFGGTQKFQNDPHWRDYIQFYEYFHGDNGAGLGASHRPVGREPLPARCTSLRRIRLNKFSTQGSSPSLWRPGGGEGQ
jgi:hypothetical protein